MKRMIRVLVLAVVGIAAVVGIVGWSVTTGRRTDVSTRVERKSLRFYKQSGEWFADVAGHTQAQNQMVAGADTLLEKISDGSSEVTMVFSSDLKQPDPWQLWLHLVEHDKYGATYRVKRAKGEGWSLAWLCNVTHDVFGGEHPQDIYIHSFTVK